MQRTCLLKKMQLAQIVAVSIRPGRAVIEIGFKARFLAVALIGVVAWYQPVAAAVCRVPAAVLCEGCVERLSIRVAPGGTCRVSFTATPSEQAASARFVDINIETVPPRTTLHRMNAPRPHAVRVRDSAVCFVFNGRRFCE